MAIIKPGSRCLLISEAPGFECNIGAVVTATAYRTFDDGHSAWLFAEASRPLLVAIFKGHPWRYVSASEPLWHLPNGTQYLSAFAARRLMPLDDDEMKLGLLREFIRGEGASQPKLFNCRYTVAPVTKEAP